VINSTARREIQSRFMCFLLFQMSTRDSRAHSYLRLLQLVPSIVMTVHRRRYHSSCFVSMVGLALTMESLAQQRHRRLIRKNTEMLLRHRSLVDARHIAVLQLRP